MTWVAVAVAGGSVIAGGLSYAGANKASKAAAKGADAAAAEQRRQFDIIRSDTAPYRAIGNQALNALGSIYGYSPTYGGGGNPLAGASLVQGASVAPESGLWGSMFDPNKMLGINSNSTLGKIIDPVHSLFGSKHGDEKRNLNAFISQNQVYDLGNGMLALADGTQFPSSKLQELAGTWYGATYHPDGDQAGWQQKYNDVLGGFKALPQNANIGKTGPGGLTSDGVPQGFTANQGMAPNGQPSTALDPNSPNYGAFFMSPDYQFRKSQGMQGIGNSFSASGGAKSGNALKALAEFNSNLAASEFGNYFNRQAALAGIGQTATTTSANAGLQTAANVGNALQGGANSRASGIAGQYDALGNALSGVGQGLGYYLANRQRLPGSAYYGYGGVNA